MAITLQQFQRKLAAVKDCVDENKVIIPALNLGLGLIKRRIFNDGKASDGTKIGVYVSDWRKVRQEAGRPVNFVNLFFTGDLSASLTRGEKEGENVLGFTTRAQTLIMENNERYRGKDISKPSASELQAVINSASRALAKSMRECFRKN